MLAPFDENAEEREEELPVVLGRGEGKRVDSEVSGLLANVQIGPAEDGCQGLEAAPNVEDVGEWLVLLCVLQHEVAKIRLATSCHAQNERVRNFPVVQVEKIGSLVVRLQDCQILRVKVRIPFLAGQDRE